MHPASFNLQRSLLLIGLYLGLSGCLNPPARWRAEDMQQRTIELPITPAQALSRFYEGTSYCGTYGLPECGPLREDGSGACDLYHSTLMGGRSGMGIGRVVFLPSATGTTAVLGIGSQPAWTTSRYERMFNGWTQMLEGRTRELCPP
jgi:hypothetical protein